MPWPFPGLSVNGLVTSPSSGAIFEVLDDFNKRKGLSAMAIAQNLNARFGAIAEPTIVTFPPPAVQGLGQLGGFRMQIEDQAGLGPEALQKATAAMVAAAAKDPRLAGVFSGYQIGVPKIRADIDREKALAEGVSPA